MSQDVKKRLSGSHRSLTLISEPRQRRLLRYRWYRYDSPDAAPRIPLVPGEEPLKTKIVSHNHSIPGEGEAINDVRNGHMAQQLKKFRAGRGTYVAMVPSDLSRRVA